MSRLPMINPDADTNNDVLTTLFDAIRDRGSEPNHLYRTLSHAPDLVHAWSSFAWPLRDRAHTPRILREVMILRMAAMARSPYVWAHHWSMGQKSGLDESRILALADPDVVGQSTEEDAVLRLADSVVRHGDLDDTVFSGLRRVFNEREVIELVLTAGFYLMTMAVTEALRVDLEDECSGHPRPWESGTGPIAPAVE